MDLTEAIAPKSDQMNAEDLLGGPRTFTITDVRRGSSEQPVWIYLAEHPQPWKPAKTVLRLMVLAWGPDSDAYIGKRVTLYRDDSVRWAGKAIGGIRLSHMSGIRKPLTAMLPPSKGTRQEYTVEPIPDGAPLPARAPGPLDQLVWAMNAAGIDQDPTSRLAYCREVLQADLRSAADMTADQLADVMAALKEQASASVPPAGDIAAERPYELTEAELAEIAERELGEQNHG
jgi:hypothetical protein